MAAGRFALCAASAGADASLLRRRTTLSAWHTQPCLHCESTGRRSCTRTPAAASNLQLVGDRQCGAVQPEVQPDAHPTLCTDDADARARPPRSEAHWLTGAGALCTLRSVKCCQCRCSSRPDSHRMHSSLCLCMHRSPLTFAAFRHAERAKPAPKEPQQETQIRSSGSAGSRSSQQLRRRRPTRSEM